MRLQNFGIISFVKNKIFSHFSLAVIGFSLPEVGEMKIFFTLMLGCLKLSAQRCTV
jgi:hypothetical protein